MYHNNGYRNAPLWEVALELRRELPDIPILCDPSHIGGRRNLVAQLSLSAMQLDYNGLMVEVHPHPDNAWSDVAQQFSPAEFITLIEKIRTSKQQITDTDAARLTPMRQQIDDIDHEMLRLLGQRMGLSRQIAEIKHDHQMPVYQSGRWADVVADRLRIAEDVGLNPTFTKELLEKIHAESVKVQMEMSDKRQ